MDSSAQKDDQVEPGYKKTKLGLIPEDWEIHRFDKIFDFKKSYSFSRNDLTFEEGEGDTFYIHYGDIHSKFDTLILHLQEENHAEIPLLKQSSKPEKDLIYLEEGDLIIADASEDYEGVGECIEIGELNNSKKLIAGLHTIVARDKNGKTVDRYRAYILKNWPVAKELKKIATGISVFGISKGNLSKLKLSLPPIPEQKKIAEILTTWDKAIETLEQLIAKKEKLKKGLMQQLLTGKKRFPGFEEVWQEVRLDKISKVVMGQSPKSEFYNEEKNGLPLLQGNNDIKKGKTVSNVYTTEITKECNTGDIILSVRAPVGEIGIAIERSCIGRGVCAIQAKNIYREYIFNYLDYFEYKWDRFSQGSTFKAINSKDIRAFKIELPASEKEITFINSTINSMQKGIEKLRNQKQAFEIQKKGLMQQLLTGKTRMELEGA